MPTTKSKNITSVNSEEELKALIAKSEQGPFYTTKQIRDEVKKWKSKLAK